MTHEIAETMLLDPRVIDNPYPLYRELHSLAPVWEIADTGLFAVSTFELVAEAASRVAEILIEHQLPPLSRRCRST